MAPGKLLPLQRNVRPLKRRASISSSSEAASSEVESNSSQNGHGEELQASSDTSDVELRDQQDAESDGGRSVGSDTRQVQEDDDRPDSINSIERDGQSEDDNKFGFREVAFGTLKRAQESLTTESNGRKRKRNSDDGAGDDKLQSVRARLREIREQRESMALPSQKSSSGRATKKDAVHVTMREASHDSTDSDSESAPSEEDARVSRTSKHAPAAQTSRHQVTRKRQVITVPKRVVRDPRFDALHRNSSHPSSNSDKAYAFLREYQNSEMDELKAAIKATKSADEKEILRRKLVSMQNRIKAKEAVERQQNVLRAHRKEERQRVEQGKNPYYLKKSELKERALIEKYKGMKGKEREKAIEKRRLKESQREKKKMPQLRRRDA